MDKTIYCLLLLCASISTVADDNRIDTIRHDAPQLAHFGDHDIGVRTLEFIDRDRPDILNTVNGGDTAMYDRRLTVEVWYPAHLAANQIAGGEYSTSTRNPAVRATLRGRAVRDADAATASEAMPLIIISHGYPGNRYLLSHLGENLASKGYVVASIDHRDSTYENQQALVSTLYNRPIDQRFVLDQMALLSEATDSFLNGLIDTERTGIVGFSMGGYGLINNLGGGYSKMLIDHQLAPPNGLAYRHTAANPEFRNGLDARIKAGFAIAPWGMTAGVWNPEDLQAIKVPTFYLAGNLDAVAGYEKGTRAIFENATGSDRYLLTFVNAGHNAGAPIPLPLEFREQSDQTGAGHYTDPVWDTRRMNNIMDHFATAFFDYHLKSDNDRLAFLQLLPDAADGVFSEVDGSATKEHTYWKGFANNTARGLTLEHLEPGE